MKFQMQCNCGDIMTVDAANKEEAIAKLKAMMTQEAVNKHMLEKHSGQPVPSLDQVHMMIEQKTQEVAAAPTM